MVHRIRPREDWARPLDGRILEACAASGFVLTPAVIAYTIEYSREEVNRRLSELERRSFVERIDRGKYRITSHGRQYSFGPLSWPIVTDSRTTAPRHSKVERS